MDLVNPYAIIIALRLAVSPLTAFEAGGMPCDKGPSIRVSSLEQYSQEAKAFLVIST